MVESTANADMFSVCNGGILWVKNLYDTVINAHVNHVKFKFEIVHLLQFITFRFDFVKRVKFSLISEYSKS